MLGTTNRSIVAIPSAWLRRNVFQPCDGGPVCTENFIRIDWSKNRLTSAHNDRAAMFRTGRLGCAIQVEESA